MIKLLVIIFMLIVLAGGAFTGLTAFGVIPDVLGLGLRMEDPPPPEPVQAAPVRPEFVEIEPFILPVILDGEGLQRSIYFNFRLKVRHGTAMDVHAHVVRVQDAMVRYLHDWIPLWLRDHDDIDLTVMKEKLRAVANRVVGEGVVEEVMLRAVFDQ
jgi:flagellar basal body-associated protein FliL